MNPVVPLNTAPVGDVSTETTSACGAPVLPLYSVLFPVALSATHHGDDALAVSPQAFTRFGSTIVPGR